MAESGLVELEDGAVQVTAAGWFLVRAIADNRRTFRFTSTAPWYVEVGGVKQRVSAVEHHDHRHQWQLMPAGEQSPRQCQPRG